jgi:HEAT repeat protein
MTDPRFADLASDSADARMAACSAIADACERGTPLDDGTEPMIALLGDPDSRVSGMATYILQTEADREPHGRAVQALRGALYSPSDAVRRLSAFLLAGSLARQEDGKAVAAMLETDDHIVRLGTLKALADGAVPREHTDAVVAALVRALEDQDVSVRKESIWALYLLGSAGEALKPAVPALERALEDSTTQGNAAIALVLSEPARAAGLYDHAVGAVQMGAAWGAADVALRAGDLATLKAMFSSENTSVRRGLGAFLNHAKTSGRDIELAGQAFSELEQANPDDAVLHARLYGVIEIVKRGADA